MRSMTRCTAGRLGGLLPNDFLSWKVVCLHKHTWPLNGDWERISTVPREWIRVSAACEPSPDVGSMDAYDCRPDD